MLGLVAPLYIQSLYRLHEITAWWLIHAGTCSSLMYTGFSISYRKSLLGSLVFLEFIVPRMVRSPYTNHIMSLLGGSLAMLGLVLPQAVHSLSRFIYFC